MSIIFNNNTGLCPCGSGREIPNCCLRPNGTLLPPQSQTRIPLATTGLPTTGLPNPECYASGYYDCVNKLSAEHYLSRSILEIVNRTHGALHFGDLYPDGRRRDRQMAPKAAAAKMLCERHNGALSTLDDFGKQLFTAIGGIDAPDGMTGDRVLLVNGHDVERWILKALCGYMASGECEVFGGRPPQWRAPLPWLDVLYGRAELPAGCGLYCSEERGWTGGGNGVSISPIGSHVSVGATEAQMNGCKFLLGLVPRGQIADAIAGEYTFRPNGVQIETVSGTVHVLFAWSGDDRNAVKIDIDPFQIVA